jgi:hypothetical protein
MIGICCLLAGCFDAWRFTPMFMGAHMNSEVASSFSMFALFGSGYAGLGN